MATDNKPTTTNGMSIAGFVCSFFVSVLGIIFGIIGLNQIKKTNEGGRGLAIAGIVIGAAGVVFSIVALILMATFGFWVTDRVDNWVNESYSSDCQWHSNYENGKWSSEYKCE